MDINARLTRIRELVRENPNDELAEHIEALDEWKSRGGFDPEAWHRKDEPAPFRTENIVQRKWEVQGRNGYWGVDQHVREAGKPWESGTRGDSLTFTRKKEAVAVAGALNSAYAKGSIEGGRDATVSVVSQV